MTVETPVRGFFRRTATEAGMWEELLKKEASDRQQLGEPIHEVEHLAAAAERIRLEAQEAVARMFTFLGG